VRVLFVGNSYTSVNDLPGMFAQLAGAGGHRVETGMAAPGGATLTDHAGSSDTLATIKSSKRGVVVLQEQSEIPAFVQLRTAQMDPAARSLVSAIQRAGAKPMFFMTWGHRDGWPEDGLPDYSSMQAQIDIGYEALASELGAAVAPVGVAWYMVHRQHPETPLWQDDGSHPTQQGTYLAACAFYAAIFNQSPEGLTYSAGLPATTVTLLQAAAAHAVLDNPAQWNLLSR
jgi:hypothetical protein